MDDLDRIGKVISNVEFEYSADIADKINLVLKQKIKRAAKIRAFIYGTASIVSVGLLYTAGRLTVSEIYQSGISQIFSLIFSDFQVVMGNLNYFLLSLAESLPIMPIIYVLLSAMALVSLIALVINNVKKVSQLNIYNFKHAKHF